MMTDLSKIIDNILQAIVIIDKNYNIVFSNEKTKKVFNEIPEGKKCYEFFYKIQEKCENCPIENENFEGIIYKTELKDFPCKITKFDNYYLKELFDYSQFFKIFESYIEDRKFIEIGHISAAIAHKVNNLLMGISGRIEAISMLKNENRLNDEYFETALNKISNNINEIKKLMDEILFFAHPERLKKEKVNINAVIKEMYIFSKFEIERPNLKFMLELNDIPDTLVEQKLIMQLILMICRILSRNFAQTSQDNRFIKIVTEKEGNSVFIKIIDNNQNKCKNLARMLSGEKQHKMNYENFIIKYCLLFHNADIEYSYKNGNVVKIKLEVKE